MCLGRFSQQLQTLKHADSANCQPRFPSRCLIITCHTVQRPTELRRMRRKHLIGCEWPLLPVMSQCCALSVRWPKLLISNCRAALDDKIVVLSFNSKFHWSCNVTQVLPVSPSHAEGDALPLWAAPLCFCLLLVILSLWASSFFLFCQHQYRQLQFLWENDRVRTPQPLPGGSGMGSSPRPHDIEVESGRKSRFFNVFWKFIHDIKQCNKNGCHFFFRQTEESPDLHVGGDLCKAPRCDLCRVEGGLFSASEVYHAIHRSLCPCLISVSVFIQVDFTSALHHTAIIIIIIFFLAVCCNFL